MKRNDMKTIIRIRSHWSFEKKNYILPSGDKLSDYVSRLLREQMELDDLCIGEDGDFHVGSYSLQNDEWTVFIPAGKDLKISGLREDILTREFIHEMVEGGRA